MIRYTVVIRPRAIAELREAFAYTQSSSPQNAVAWLKGIWKAIDSLETMPERRPFARERPQLGADIRQFVYHSHRILYTVEKKTVVIHHIRHAKMDSIKELPGASRSSPANDDPST